MRRGTICVSDRSHPCAAPFEWGRRSSELRRPALKRGRGSSLVRTFMKGLVEYEFKGNIEARAEGTRKDAVL